MAMALYGREIDDLADLFGGGSSYLPSSSRLPHNELESRARSLPRPKRRRKKREAEAPLYPSLAAIEDCVPEPFFNFGDSSSGSLHPVKAKNRQDDEPLDALMGTPSRPSSSRTPSQPPQAAAAAASTQPRSSTSSLLLPSRSDHSSSLGSCDRSSSDGSQELLRDFRRISLTTNKRKPISHGSSLGDGDGDGRSESYSALPAYEDPHVDSFPHSPPRSSLFDSSKRGGSDDRQRSASSNRKYYHQRTKDYDSAKDALYKEDPKKTYKSYGRTGGSLSRLGSLLNSVNADYDTPLTMEECLTANLEKRARHLEIEPGLLLPLRGAEETVKAIKSGFVEKVSCQACENELYCIADATFCVCPDCKCVFAVSGATLFDTSKTHKLYPGGSVGLGFRTNHNKQRVHKVL